MRVLRKLYMKRVLLVITILLCTNISFAKSFIYLSNSSDYARVDIETNTLVQMAVTVPANVSNAGFLAVDAKNKYLYLRHCQVDVDCNVGVYDLITLKFIKELQIGAQDYNIKMVLYPDASKFLIQYLLPADEIDPEGDPGGYVTFVYDAKTHEELKNIEEYISLEKVAFSNDGKKLFSIIKGSEAKLFTYDSATFQNIEIKDLTTLWRKRPAVFGAGIESSANGKLVIVENLKTSRLLPDKLDFIIYDMETGALSPRISTGLEGTAKLIGDGNKMILDENETLWYSGAAMGSKSLGKLHFYDVSNGKQIGVAEFPVKGEGEVLQISQAGDLLYYRSEGSSENSSAITVIDTKSYKPVTTINMPFHVDFSIVFDN